MIQHLIQFLQLFTNARMGTHTMGETETKFCMKMVYRSLTKSGAESNCASSGGQVTVLIEDDKHVIAGQLSAAVYSASQ